MTDYGSVEVEHFDYGRLIGLAVTRDGERRTIRVVNPFWEENAAHRKVKA